MSLIPPTWTFSTHDSMNTTPSNTIILTGTVKILSAEDELFQGYSDGLLSFASAACIFFILIGVPGNLVTIIALFRCNKARNATAIFIINLALSDLLSGCFNLPLAASTFLKRSWRHSELLCRLFPLLRYGLLAVSLLTILSITINRYIMIGHPRIYPRVYRHRYLNIMVAGTWLVSFSIMIPTWRGIWGRFGLDATIGSCSILPDYNGRSPKEFLFVTAFMVPCICIIVCYARIFYIVRRAAFRSREPALTNSSTNICRAKNQKSTAVAENNYSDQQLIENNFKISKEENSEVSCAPFSSSTDRLSSQQVAQKPSTTTRPFLSKLSADEMKFIDTSVESDFPPTLSALRIREKHEERPASHDGSLSESYAEKNRTSENYFAATATNNDCTKEALLGLFTANNIEHLHIETHEQSRSSISNDLDNPKTKRSFKNTLTTSINRVKKHKFHYTSTVNTSNASILYPGRMSQKDRRLLKMILMIFISFVICYLPITVTKLWKGVTEVHFINISGYLLIYLTTCINPIIYVVMSSEYRQAYWNLLMCKTGNKASRQNNRANM